MTHEDHNHHHSPSAGVPPERQAVCPVTGDTVDTQEAQGAGHVRDYKGKEYYFCCATCAQLFDKNPEKYIPNV